jgi:hypothetical protein
MDPASSQEFAVLAPLLISLAPIVVTIVIHAVALGATIKFIRREYEGGRAGVRFWRDVAIVAGVILLALIAHLADISVWAVLYEEYREFTSFGSAFYSSAMIYTTLGGVNLSASWKLLAPLEAGNALLMFGVSTATIFAVMQQLFQTRTKTDT